MKTTGALLAIVNVRIYRNIIAELLNQWNQQLLGPYETILAESRVTKKQEVSVVSERRPRKRSVRSLGIGLLHANRIYFSYNNKD
jgi:hypothetical protein